MRKSYVALTICILTTVFAASAFPQAKEPQWKVPYALIKIDGNFDDWKNVTPAFSNPSPTIEGNLGIQNVYLAADLDYLYMRFDIKDPMPSSSSHPNNFNSDHKWTSYGIDMKAGQNWLVIQLYFNNAKNKWALQMLKSDVKSTKWQVIEEDDADYVMNGSSFEAAFPLKLIRAQLGSDSSYRISARTGYQGNDKWIETDVTPKTFIAIDTTAPSTTPAAAPATPLIPTGAPGPWDTGLFTGFIIDITGYALYTAGGAVAGDDLGVAISLLDIGSLGMTVGGFVWNSFLDQKHFAYERQGIATPDDLRNLSWNLVWVSVGCTAGSIVTGLISGEGTFIASLILGVAGAAVEAANIFAVRNEWAAALNVAYNKKQISFDEPTVVPIVDTTWNTSTRSVDVCLGVSLRY